MPNKNFNSDAAPKFGDGGKGGKPFNGTKSTTGKPDFKQNPGSTYPKQKSIAPGFKSTKEMVDKI